MEKKNEIGVPFVEIIEVTSGLSREDANTFARKNNTFLPFIRIYSGKNKKYFYEVIRIADESLSKIDDNQILNSRLGLIFRYPYAFTLEIHAYNL